MIYRLPGGGLCTGAMGGLRNRAEEAELADELERMYVAGIHERARAAGYRRHVRFEHGTVRELPPAPAARTVRQVAPAPDAREISGTFLAEMFLAYHAAAMREGQR